jgi:hypothetical protein
VLGHGLQHGRTAEGVCKIDHDAVGVVRLEVLQVKAHQRGDGLARSRDAHAKLLGLAEQAHDLVLQGAERA